MGRETIYDRAYFHYLPMLSNTDRGMKILDELKNDPRTKSLEGVHTFTGRGFGSYSPENLAIWYLWASDKFSETEARLGLDSYLDSDKIPILNTLWIVGVIVKEPIILSNEIRILPIQEIPDSEAKELYLETDRKLLNYSYPMPKAAIVCEPVVERTVEYFEDPSPILERNKEYSESIKLLEDTCLLLNLIEGISSTPYCHATYSMPKMPFGMFNGSSSSTFRYDVIGYRAVELKNGRKSEINKLLKSFLELEEEEKGRFRRILSRLSQAKRRDQIEDKILDLSIALEMSLLDDNKKYDQLSLSFRLRGSWLIASNAIERDEVYNYLKKLYDYRSQVAHSGAFKKNTPENKRLIKQNLSNYCSIAERIICKLIHDGQPDWDLLILGSDKPRKSL
ncbi:MAG: hypothetical protein AB2689_19690 [Candidatus Thiodiazotropha taylori]